MGFTNGQVERDTVNVIKDINHEDTNLSAAGNLVYEARLVKSLFYVCKVLHTERARNNLAHAISKDAFFSNTYTKCPLFISSIVAKECTSIIR